MTKNINNITASLLLFASAIIYPELGYAGIFSYEKIEIGTAMKIENQNNKIKSIKPIAISINENLKNNKYEITILLKNPLGLKNFINLGNTYLITLIGKNGQKKHVINDTPKYSNKSPNGSVTKDCLVILTGDLPKFEINYATVNITSKTIKGQSENITTQTLLAEKTDIRVDQDLKTTFLTPVIYTLEIENTSKNTIILDEIYRSSKRISLIGSCENIELASRQTYKIQFEINNNKSKSNIHSINIDYSKNHGKKKSIMIPLNIPESINHFYWLDDDHWIDNNYNSYNKIETETEMHILNKPYEKKGVNVKASTIKYLEGNEYKIELLLENPRKFKNFVDLYNTYEITITDNEGIKHYSIIDDVKYSDECLNGSIAKECRVTLRSTLPSATSIYSFRVGITSKNMDRHSESIITKNIYVEKPEISIEKTQDTNTILPTSGTYTLKIKNNSSSKEKITLEDVYRSSKCIDLLGAYKNIELKAGVIYEIKFKTNNDYAKYDRCNINLDYFQDNENKAMMIPLEISSHLRAATVIVPAIAAAYLTSIYSGSMLSNPIIPKTNPTIIPTITP